MAERKKLFELGRHTSDIEQAIKNLLSSDVIAVLPKCGFLPGYAFALDLVTLETGTTQWSRDLDVELSRDRGIAIAEFAPAAQVIAHKKVFTSKGLYVVGNMDRPTRQWYSECPDCKQTRTGQTQDELCKPCGVCRRSTTAPVVLERYKTDRHWYTLIAFNLFDWSGPTSRRPLGRLPALPNLSP